MFFHFRHGILIALCILTVKALDGPDNFIWLENSDLADCVCGISFDRKPIGIGVFFDKNLILTSATAIEPYVHNLSALTVDSIFGAYNKGLILTVTCAIPSYAANRSDYWQPLGYDETHSGIHDLMVLHVNSPIGYDLAPEAVNAAYRHAFSLTLATWYHRILAKGFLIPGFGFVDEDHVKRMNVMEMEVYEEQVLVDCDDYIPREWGRFICIANIRNATGVQSGSPLIQRHLLYGIGSFALEKGADNILVFTDVRDYVSNLHYCELPGEQKEWISRYWIN